MLNKKEKFTIKKYTDTFKVNKKTATRDLQELVNLTILIKNGRTGKGVYYSLNPTYYCPFSLDISRSV
ncbi:MAG: DeoR family transcriptional regulator [Thermotogota bacterium]|nr:DeoR family transcriptional regulator [Thermotogota bacterium]